MDTEDKKSVLPPSQEETQVDPEENIKLLVQDQTGESVQFMIKRKSKFRKMMDAYCNRKNLDLKAVRFSYDGNRLRPDDSIISIQDLQDGDTIEVFTEQQGGQ